MSDDAIPAATLIVVRERASGPPELLMVERAQDMAARGMTQKQIAMRLGKSQPTVSRYLRRAA